MVKFSKASEIAAEDMHIGVLLHGNPGAGKTHAASTAPHPFVLLTEKNGLTTIKRANPNAVVAVCRNINDVRDVLKLAIAGELPHGCTTLVVDSLTEVQRLFRDEIMAGKQPGQVFSLQDWGTMADKMRLFMRTLRDLPYNVIATSLSEVQVSDTDGVRYIRPAFDGKKTGNEIAQYFNGVAYIYKRLVTDDKGEDIVSHYAMFDGPSNYVTKACHPLAGTMGTNIGEWYELLAGTATADKA